MGLAALIACVLAVAHEVWWAGRRQTVRSGHDDARTGSATTGESPFPRTSSVTVKRLVDALPDVPPATVRAAADLAWLGSDVEDLVRLLDLTSPQALRIVVTMTRATR